MKIQRNHREQEIAYTQVVPDGATLTLDEREFQQLRDWLLGVWPEHSLWWLRQHVVFADGRSEQ